MGAPIGWEEILLGQTWGMRMIASLSVHGFLMN